MGNSVGALLVTLSISLGQASGPIDQEERDFQDKVYQQWWGNEIVWKFDDLPTEGKVSDERVPYSGYIYPDTAGGTMSALRKYDMAFNSSRLLATSHERRDTSQTEQTMRQVTERFGFFGGQVRTYSIVTNATPAWYGHCNGWTSAAIRHAEPKKEVSHNGVVFTPADIKGLLAEIYMYNDPQMLAGDGTQINPGLFHALMTNWIGTGKHPIGMEADPGKEKWNYPVYGYTMQMHRHSPEYVEVGMNIQFAQSSRGEFQQSPRIPGHKYFHYRLQLDADGDIVGGWYYGDSSRIDMLWVPLRPKPSGKEGNERGNPHVDVDEVLALWRKSVPDNLRRSWVIIDPPNHAPVIELANKTSAEENQLHVAMVKATDEDLSDQLTFAATQELTYSITGGVDRAAFAINTVSGELMFDGPRDFENPNDVDKDNVYEIQVTVDDGAGASDSRLLSVRVTNTNDAPAILSNAESTTAENQLAVLKVACEDQDDSEQSLTCFLAGGPDKKVFSFDTKTRMLTFKETPDFERPRDFDKDNTYEVKLAVEDSKGAVDTQLFRITVANANDAPVITSSDSAKVAENQRSVLTIERKDDDEPKQKLLCAITGGKDHELFSIDPVTGQLSFKQAPDFELPSDDGKDNIYEVEIGVDDGVGGTATQQLIVSVIDRNDAPTITSAAKLTIKENENAVGTVSYRDEDLPKQSVTCSLVGGADYKRFTIDPKHGKLAFKEAPNFERPTDRGNDNVYEVNVAVTDADGASTKQTLSVRIVNANDAPVIRSSESLTSPELQTNVCNLSAIDEDSPAESLHYSITGGSDRSKFVIDKRAGALSFKRQPDFETPADKDRDNIYQVDVQVADDDGGLSQQSLRVSVTDANDRPVITTKEVAQSPEGRLAALTIVASDQDTSRQTLRYSLRGGADRKRFSIDSATGELTFKQAPNFEEPADADRDNLYEVRAKVEDGNGGSSTQMIQVAVTDINDAPIIRSTDRTQIGENQVAALTVSSTDEDRPSQTVVTSIVGGNDAKLFTLDAATGALRFLNSPDFEHADDSNHDNVYEVEIAVEDDAGGSATQLVHVEVTDINERPMITYTPKVQENQSEVLTIDISDEDTTMQDFAITLSGGNDRTLFLIDAKTGDLSFKTAPDFEAPRDANTDNIYEVEVKVDDGRGGVAVQTIRVKVTDIAEPVVAVKTAEVTSDNSEGTVVTTRE